MEDYLETIYILTKRLPVVRSIDIATELGYSKPSVSVAMKNLKNKDFITVSNEGYVFLTSRGHLLASEIFERHTVLSNWLISLGVIRKQHLKRPVKSNMTSVLKLSKYKKSIFLNLNKKV